MAPGVLDELEEGREMTLRLVRDLSEEELRAQPDPEWSPIGWHLGHVAFTEASWLLGRVRMEDGLVRPYVEAFSQTGRPKLDRVRLPPRADLFRYLREVRERVREVLHRGPSPEPPFDDAYVASFVACHEHQHRETMAIVLRLLRDVDRPTAFATLEDEGDAPRLVVPGGELVIGTHDRAAYDNERPAHSVELLPFAIDAHPVTAAAWERFRSEGGYRRDEFWSSEGRAFRDAHFLEAPHGWRSGEGGWARARLHGMAPLDGREPVVGVSYFEAEAYAHWRGGRLPTEAEWEALAALSPSPRVFGLVQDGPLPVQPDGERPTDVLGNVWEWTASAFAPYDGFEAFPYEGYSVPYFGEGYRVLRGGSFATAARIARKTFRNFYPPGTRTLFAGLRVAYDLEPARRV